MTISEQAQYLIEKGEFIVDRHHLESKRLLYNLVGKFYEIIYLPNENVIEAIKLRPLDYVIKYYSDKVDISSI